MSIKDYSTTAGSNTLSPPNGWPEGMTIANVNNTGRQMMADIRNLAAADTIAAASTTDIGSKDATFLTLTGIATTINALGTVSAGIYKFIVYNAAHTVTYNATSLILIGNASRTVTAGDVSLFVSEGSGNWRELFFSSDAGFQPLDNELTALATATAAPNKIPMFSGASTATTLDLSTNTSLGTSNTTVSTQNAVKTYVDTSSTTAATTAKVSSNDTTPGYLNGKLVAGTNVTFTENNNGANETLTISASGGVGTDHGVGQIGSFAMLQANGASVNSGATTAGSNLIYVYWSAADSSVANNATNPAGTWRNVSGVNLTAPYHIGLFQRIS